MKTSNPEYLEREEPARIPVGGFKFAPKKLTKKERREVLWQDGCLAEELANASGFNSASDVKRNNTTYGDKKTFEDGTTEQIVGCTSCGAMCTIVVTEHKAIAPGTEDDPNAVISVAEMPQPNPWAEPGTFGDCKAGKVSVEPETPGLTEPVNLDPTHRLIFKLLSGVIDD